MSKIIINDFVVTLKRYLIIMIFFTFSVITSSSLLVLQNDIKQEAMLRYLLSFLTLILYYFLSFFISCFLFLVFKNNHINFLISTDYYYTFFQLKSIIAYDNNLDLMDYFYFLSSYQTCSNYNNILSLLDNHHALTVHNIFTSFFESDIEDYSFREDPYIEDMIDYNSVFRFLISPMYIELLNPLNSYSLIFLDQIYLSITYIYENFQIKVIKDNLFSSHVKDQVYHEDIWSVLSTFLISIKNILIPNYINLNKLYLFSEMFHNEYASLVDLYQHILNYSEIVNCLIIVQNITTDKEEYLFFYNEFFLQKYVNEYDLTGIIDSMIEFDNISKDYQNQGFIKNFFFEETVLYLDTFILLYLVYFYIKYIKIKNIYTFYKNENEKKYGGIV